MFSFGSIGAKLINKIDILNFYDNLFTFKTVLFRNINLIVKNRIPAFKNSKSQVNKSKIIYLLEEPRYFYCMSQT
jgi:hypothetical protein